MRSLLRMVIGAGTDPDLIAQRVLDGIDRRALYILPNPDNLFEGVRARFANVLAAGPSKPS